MPTRRRPTPPEPRLFGRAHRTRRARHGLDATLAALRATGRLELVDAAWIALARVSADELDAACSDDAESRYTRGVLIARHLAVLDSLTARPDTTAADDLDALLAAALEPDTGSRDTAPS